MSELLQRARREGAPLIDGDLATFVWSGSEVPRVAGDFNGWGWGDGGLELEPAGEGVWARTISLPRDAYIEYRFNGVGKAGLDPLNSRSIADGLGGRNSYFSMPEARHTPLVRVSRATSRGK